MEAITKFLNEYKPVFKSIFNLWGIYFILIILVLVYSPTIKLEQLGLFGDSFNVLTSLFTGLAFAGVIVSVILQTKELSESREEFKGQKDEMIKQTFDNKFFQMLNSFNNLISNLKTGQNSEGRKVIRNMHSSFKNTLTYKSKMDTSYFIEEFEKFNRENSTTFKFYFINLYQLLKYIDSDTPKDIDARKYSKIIRAQLSSAEITLLFYNAMGMELLLGNKDYKRLIEKYEMLEHITYEDLIFDRPNVYNDLFKEFAKDLDLKIFGKNKDLISKFREFQ